MGNDLTSAENAALVIWSSRWASRDTLLAAVREAVAITERRCKQSEDHRIAFLREELAAVRDIAYRGAGDPASALDAIHARACRALNEE